MDDNNSGTDNVIFYPDFEKLKTEVEKLRTELSMLVLERDELVLVECKNIEMAYILLIGGLEYKAYELECTLLRLKRKIELIQAKKNRQEKVILTEIEEALNSEFAEYQKTLNERLGKINNAIERNRLGRLTEEEVRELKKLYRAIVKQLHPDIHPDLPKEKMQLFYNAVIAYENGDLNSLRMISAVVCGGELPDEIPDSLSLLAKERERLKGLLVSVKENIEEIKSEYPYTMKTLVQSTEKIEVRKSEIEKYIARLTESITDYKAIVDEMMK